MSQGGHMSLREVTFLGKGHSCHLTLMALQASQKGLRKEEFFPSRRAQLELKFRWDSRVLQGRNCQWVGNLISLTIRPVLVNDRQEWSGKMGLLWSLHPVHKMEIGQHCMLFARMEEMTQTPHTSACVESGTIINRTSGFTEELLFSPVSPRGWSALFKSLAGHILQVLPQRTTESDGPSPSLVMQFLCRKRKEPRSSSKTTGTQKTQSWWNEFNYQLPLLLNSHWWVKALGTLYVDWAGRSCLAS